MDEVKLVADQLDPKYKFLAKAPVEDPDGNRTFVKFSRKTKEQYVAGVKEDGKASGWAAFYKNGKWQEKE